MDDNTTLAYMTGYGKHKRELQERYKAALAVIEVMKGALEFYAGQVDPIGFRARNALAAVREFEGKKNV